MCDLVEEKGRDTLSRYLFENYGQTLDDFIQEKPFLDNFEKRGEDHLTESEEELVNLNSEDLRFGTPFEELTDSELLLELREFYKLHDINHFLTIQYPEKQQQLLSLARAKGRYELNRALYNIYQAYITPLKHERAMNLSVAEPHSPNILADNKAKGSLPEVSNLSNTITDPIERDKYAPFARGNLMVVGIARA
eukprot:snap_masked-scaffold_12-processed-gene-6.18-mRNA-1 protein AED:1.00 eAED:1.00 QI:0/-1/0/0/-1/1/1/0/193